VRFLSTILEAEPGLAPHSITVLAGNRLCGADLSISRVGSFKKFNT